MNNFFLVLRNIKHDGEAIVAGQIVEAAEGAFLGLIEAGAMRVIEGATSIEDAAEKVKAELAAKGIAAQAVAAAKPANTWPDKPAPAPVEEKPADTTVETTETTEEKAPETKTEETPVVAPVVGEGDLPPAPGTETGDNL